MARDEVGAELVRSTAWEIDTDFDHNRRLGGLE